MTEPIAPEAHWGICIVRPPEEAETIIRALMEKLPTETAWVHHKADDVTKHDHTHLYMKIQPMPSPDAARTALKKWMNRKGLKGNADFCVVYYDKGFASFAHYAKHSGEPLQTTNETLRELYDASAVYVKPRQQEQHEDDDDDADNDNAPLKNPYKALTDYNIVKLMRRHCRLHRIGTRNFKQVFDSMMLKTRWRPGKGLTRPLLPPLIEAFEHGDAHAVEGWWKYINSRPAW